MAVQRLIWGAGAESAHADEDSIGSDEGVPALSYRGFYADLHRLMPEVEIVEVPAAEVSLADAIASYLFNAQLVTTAVGPTLIVPSESRANAAVWAWLERHRAGNGPIRRVETVDVTQSMANGGGPACLRLRVVADPATIAEGPQRELWAARGKGWVSDAELAEINRLLVRLTQLLRKSRAASRNRLVALSWVLAPIAAKPSRRAKAAPR